MMHTRDSRRPIARRKNSAVRALKEKSLREDLNWCEKRLRHYQEPDKRERERYVMQILRKDHLRAHRLIIARLLFSAPQSADRLLSLSSTRSLHLDFLRNFLRPISRERAVTLVRLVRANARQVAPPTRRRFQPLQPFFQSQLTPHANFMLVCLFFC